LQAQQGASSISSLRIRWAEVRRGLALSGQAGAAGIRGLWSVAKAGIAQVPASSPPPTKAVAWRPQVGSARTSRTGSIPWATADRNVAQRCRSPIGSEVVLRQQRGDLANDSVHLPHRFTERLTRRCDARQVPWPADGLADWSATGDRDALDDANRAWSAQVVDDSHRAQASSWVRRQATATSAFADPIGRALVIRPSTHRPPGHLKFSMERLRRQVIRARAGSRKTTPCRRMRLSAPG